MRSRPKQSRSRKTLPGTQSWSRPGLSRSNNSTRRLPTSAMREAQHAAMSEEVKAKTRSAILANHCSDRRTNGRALLTEGNLVNAGAPDSVLATILDIDPINIYFSVDEPCCRNSSRLSERARASVL